MCWPVTPSGGFDAFRAAIENYGWRNPGSGLSNPQGLARLLFWLRLFPNPLLCRSPAADRALTKIVPTGGAILTPEVDNLQVEVVPRGLGKERL